MIFVDTGAFLGRYLPDDQHHGAALAGWAQLAEEEWPICTSNLVLSETITLLARRTDYRFAAERARVIHASSALRILPLPSKKNERRSIGWRNLRIKKSVSPMRSRLR